MCCKRKFKKVIGDINLWEKLKETSLNNKKYSMYDWHHHKYYKVSKDNDGFKMQEFKVKGKILSEIPYEREFFNFSSGRFSLKKNPVAYFSNDYATACCETIDLFRMDDNLTFVHDLKPYFEGKTNPTPGLMGYPMSVKIKADSLILDLTISSNTLINHINSNFSSDFFDKIIISRSPESYTYSRIISELSFSNGFDGIIFKSVRVESDWKHPDKNLVLFNKNKIFKT
jgi:hypothetical protein